MGEVTGSGSLIDGATASAIVNALARATPRVVATVRPEMEDGHFVDGTVVWMTDHARAAAPDIEVGTRVSDIVSGTFRLQQMVLVADAVISQPGVPMTRGPFTVSTPAGDHHFGVNAVYEDGLVVLEYEDVTEVVRTRKERDDSQHDFHHLLDGLDAGVVLLRPVLGPTGRVVDAELMWANEASRSMWNNQAGLAPGTKVSDVYYDQEDWLLAANDAWNGITSFRVLAVDPTVAPWSHATETLRRVGDTLVELTIDRSRDQQLLEKLEQLDHTFAALVEDLPLTVLVVRIGEDELEFVSPNATELTGLPMSELRRLSQWTALIAPEDAHLGDAAVAAISTTGHFESTQRFVHPDGHHYWTTARMVRRTGPNGDGFITLISDVTDEMRLRERLASGDRLETLGRTAGSIAHDFNNLLMIVGGSIDRARRQLVDSIPLDTAAAATKRAADLASSLLGFARGRPGAPTDVAVGPLVESFLPILRGIVHPKADLVVDVEDRTLTVWADRTHVEQLILNLVTNARDAAPNGSQVHLRVRRVDHAECHLVDHPAPGPYVAISVTDHGDGVPDAIVGRIWEPFFSAKPTTEDSGTGLGLATVHGTAHQHDGHVQLHTRPGGPTTFVVTLPEHRAGLSGPAR